MVPGRAAGVEAAVAIGVEVAAGVLTTNKEGGGIYQPGYLVGKVAYHGQVKDQLPTLYQGIALEQPWSKQCKSWLAKSRMMSQGAYHGGMNQGNLDPAWSRLPW